MAITEPHGGEGSAVCARGGDTSSRRWLQSWPRFSTTAPHRDRGRPGQGGGRETNYTATLRKMLPPQAAGAQHFAMDAGEDDGEAPAAGRPAPLLEVLPQERVRRRTVEQIVDCVPEVPLLDAPVPQTVVQLVEVLRPLDIVVPEQVIEVPKITFHDAIPQRAVLPVPQMAEQLVDEPVPSFDDFELVEASEEEEEELPRMVPGTRAWDAEGHEWSRVVGPAGSAGGVSTI